VLVAARQGQRRDAVATKARKTTLLQPEVKDSADVQRGRVKDFSADVQRGRVSKSGFLGAKALHH
jgi:hypothetical protein